MKNSTYPVRKLLFLFVSFLFYCHFSSAQTTLPPGLTAKSLTASNGDFIGFYEYKPVDYDPNHKYPVIIFLHGIGERGNGTSPELERVLANGTPRNIKDGHNMKFFWNGKWETFLVLIPQLSGKYGWWPSHYVDEMLKYANANLSVDPNRIFLTGLSLGGGGVWSYVISNPENAKKFAAIGVSCGTCQYGNWNYISDANLPTWAWHAADDGTVGAGCSTSAINNINSYNPAVKPYLTIWPTGNHWIWGRVYSTAYDAQHPNIYEWFLGQDKSKPVNKRPVADAGGTINITTGLGAINLDASASYDPDGKILQYIWTQKSGPVNTPLPSGGILTNAIASLTGLLTAGTYTYELRVIDDRADWTTATLTVNVSLGAPPPNKPPVANAGNDISIQLPDNSTPLNGSGSSDPDGKITSYSWSYVSGPSQYTLSNSNTANATLSNLTQGTYTFKLKVTDNGGLSHEDNVNVTVLAPAPPPNTPPNARAGNDITLTLPTNSTTLDGSGSNEPDANGWIAAYAWSFVSGPAQYTFADPNAASTGLSNLVEGTYAFRLEVTDNGGLKSADTVIVTVDPDTSTSPPTPPGNRAPDANAGGNIAITLPVDSTTLNGSATDPDNNIASYAWLYVSGPAQYHIANPDALSTSLSELVEGIYNFRLLVTDSLGLTDSDTIIVAVNAVPPPTNQYAVPIAGNDTTITLPKNSVTLNGSASYDPDGPISGYEWLKLSGPSQYAIASKNAVTTTLSNLVQGTYVIKLRVWDNLWIPTDDTIRITVLPEPNKPPVANAGSDITITLPTNSLTLNGTGSTDPNKNISGYQWTKLSGPAQYNFVNGGSASTAVNNLVEGSYAFRLVVTDAGGLSDDDTVLVTVKPAPNQRPVANAGSNKTITLPVNSATLSGTASSDADGTIASYQWTRIAGPAQHTINNPTSGTTVVSGLVQGVYTFRLVVTDNGGLTDDDSVLVTVKPSPPPPPNQKPTANAGADISITLPTDSTTLNGLSSTDGDGNIAGYQWSKLSGPAQFNITSSTSGTTGVTGLVQGTYLFRLVVTDNSAATDDDTVQVTVHAAPPPPNRAPVANAGADFTVSLPNPAIQLNGSASHDPDGTITGYSWAKVSGPGAITITNSTSAKPGVIGVQAGGYIFELTVTDNKGAKAKDQVKVTVQAAVNIPPVASAGRDTGIAVPASSAVLDGRASYDPDGIIVNYLWKQISGPASSMLANMNGSVTVVNELETGEYEFELTVTDNKGASSKDSMRVNVVNNFRYIEKLQVYPNPAPTSTLNIRCISDSTGIVRMTIYDMNGRALKTFQTVKSQSFLDMPLNISMLKKGVYWLEVSIENKKRMITKFIKR